MKRAFWPLLNTILFTIIVPGTVAGYIPFRIVGGFSRVTPGALSLFGGLVLAVGAGIYFRCAWEFAVRGLGTPAPIAPTKYLITTALHRYVRNPMYIGVALVILGEAALFRSPYLVVYAALMLSIAHIFVVAYEEPALHRQFGESYDEYRRTIPRWIPRFRRRAV